MGNAIWVRAALIGREIIGATGERAAIADFGDTGALVESRDTRQTAMVPLQEITATIQLWGRLKRSPRPAEVVGLGLDASRAAFLSPPHRRDPHRAGDGGVAPGREPDHGRDALATRRPGWTPTGGSTPYGLH